MSLTNLPRPVTILGLAGILPQAICVVIAFTSPPLHGVAAAAGLCYAAIIASFLGGLWWMAGVLTTNQKIWVYGIAVTYSLVAWAALLPLCLGWHRLPAALVVMGLLLLASPAVDGALARHVSLPEGWRRLLLLMATGLGATTLLLALL
jgi:hypothetical protein